MLKKIIFLSFVIFVSALCGCSTFKEVYHFKATDGDTVNYYRTTVSGWTLFSASQYAAGNYDADAVDALFGELTGAKINADSIKLAGHTPRTTAAGPEIDKGAANPPPPTASQSTFKNTETSTPKVETLSGENMEHKKFVFFLSSNSDFFVNQINTYVTTRDMQQSIVTLLLKDDIAKLQEARISRDIENASAEALATRLRSVAAELKSPAGSLTNQDTIDRIVKILRAMASKSNVSSGVNSINTVENGKTWLQNNPGAFTIGVNP